MRHTIWTLFIGMTLLFFGAGPAAADTILIGFDTTGYANTTCWDGNVTTIQNYSWKAMRFYARASGTISYVKIRSPSAAAGCTNDAGCWAVYEGTMESDVPGALKGWACFSGYDWSAGGVGDHIFPVTNTGTSLTVTQGSVYWVVMYSTAMDATYYANAGCTTSHVSVYRGKAPEACYTTEMLTTEIGSLDYPSATINNSTVTVPPTGSTINVPTATYYMIGVWEEIPPSTVKTVSGIHIR